MEGVEKYFSVEEISEHLKTNRDFLYKEIRRGNLKAKRIGKRLLRVREIDLQDYLKN